jgi:RNA polymerase sigma factor (sigma-70 family)
MMHNPLLQRYVKERSEPAFAELVRQHIDLVHSAALRQVNGDPAAAQDVTQAVFTDLARKAPRLLRHPSLTGWLYTSTRYLAANARRTEQRRIAREQEAYAMNQLLQPTDSDPAWQQLRPVIDEAMHDLTPDDREAVLLRFFERRSVAEIGTKLGLSEDTARKRVSRALDKLRAALAKRGITSTVAALSVALSECTVSAAPTGMVGLVSHAAVTTAGAGSGAIAGLWKLLVGAGAAATIAGSLILPKILHQNAQAATTASSVATSDAAVISAAPIQAEASPETTPATTTGASASATTSSPLSADNLTLHVVTADSGKPIPMVKLDYWLFLGSGVKHLKPLTASPQGVCEVPVPRENLTELLLVSERDGFADTRLQWHVDHGETIPQEYTLRLTRAVMIGGTVVDPDGNPVAGAEVGFNNRVDASLDTARETSDFGWPFWITATTDAHGHWQLDRMTKETIRTIYGGASHPLYVPSNEEGGSIGFGGVVEDAQKQLLAGTHVFRLGRAVQARGSVVDNNGNPISNAHITVGPVGRTTSRETNAGADGHFLVAGCVPEKTVLSAEAKGFAPTSLPVDLSASTGPFQLTLQAGKLLRLRVLDTKGAPVTNASIWLDTVNNNQMINVPASARVQTDFNRKTGSDGRLEWPSAPEGDLIFDFSAPGFQRLSNQKISADGQEHIITLTPGLIVSGTVQDATTGAPIPRFRIAAGWPQTNPVTGEVQNQWSSIDRFWMSFAGGKFQHEFDEPVLGGTPNPGYVFKFMADGYVPSVSRPVAFDEGKVELDITLQPGNPSVITVTVPDGRPAANVDVGLVSMGARLNLLPGGFSRANLQSGGSLFATDAQGHFTLNPDTSVFSVVAASAEGYAETTPAALADAPTMVLQPWGRLEGTLFAQGLAASNCTVAFRLGDDRRNGIQTDFNAYQTKTDDNGHFVFAKVPPGRRQLVQMIEVPGTPSPNGMVWIDQPVTNVDIRPGETTTITVTAPTANP